jgi:sortase A
MEISQEDSMMRTRTWVFLFVLGAGMAISGKGIYLQAKATLAQHLLQSAWQQTLEGGKQVKPWPWADTWPVARMQVPGRDIDLIVLSGASGRTLAFAPGHLAGTASPGEKGVSLVSAHRDTHFRFLGELKKKEQILVQKPDGRRITYVITHYGIVNANHARFPVRNEQDSLILLTCYPFQSLHAGTDLRYFVIARKLQKPRIPETDV